MSGIHFRAGAIWCTDGATRVELEFGEAKIEDRPRSSLPQLKQTSGTQETLLARMYSGLASLSMSSGELTGGGRANQEKHQVSDQCRFKQTDELDT
jgi:hypothetical protein